MNQYLHQLICDRSPPPVEDRGLAGAVQAQHHNVQGGGEPTQALEEASLTWWKVSNKYF